MEIFFAGWGCNGGAAYQIPRSEQRRCGGVLPVGRVELFVEAPLHSSDFVLLLVRAVREIAEAILLPLLQLLLRGLRRQISRGQARRRESQRAACERARLLACHLGCLSTHRLVCSLLVGPQIRDLKPIRHLVRERRRIDHERSIRHLLRQRGVLHLIRQRGPVNITVLAHLGFPGLFRLGLASLARTVRAGVLEVVELRRFDDSMDRCDGARNQQQGKKNGGDSRHLLCEREKMQDRWAAVFSNVG